MIQDGEDEDVLRSLDQEYNVDKMFLTKYPISKTTRLSKLQLLLH